jgi:hypothetical protein
MASIDKNTLLELLSKLGMGEDIDFLREGVKVLTCFWKPILQLLYDLLYLLLG